MSHDVIATCPVCSNELAVTRLHCRSCGTTLEGDFSVGRFGRLTRESSPSSRASCGRAATCARWSASSGSATRRFALGSRHSSARSGSAPARTATDPAEPSPALDRDEILEALARHEMNAEDAAAAICSLGRNKP